MSFVVSEISPGPSTKGTRHGLDEEDVENRILESLHHNKDKRKSLALYLHYTLYILHSPTFSQALKLQAAKANKRNHKEVIGKGQAARLA